MSPSGVDAARAAQWQAVLRAFSLVRARRRVLRPFQKHHFHILAGAASFVTAWKDLLSVIAAKVPAGVKELL